MAKVTGVKCDVCEKFEATVGNGHLPVGWIVVMPYSSHDRDEHRFELCSNKCMKKLADERVKAEAPEKSAKGNKVSPSIKAALAAMGIEGKAMGSYVGTHNRYHQDEPNPDCPVCQVETSVS